MELILQSYNVYSFRRIAHIQDRRYIKLWLSQFESFVFKYACSSRNKFIKTSLVNRGDRKNSRKRHERYPKLLIQLALTAWNIFVNGIDEIQTCYLYVYTKLQIKVNNMYEIYRFSWWMSVSIKVFTKLIQKPLFQIKSSLRGLLILFSRYVIKEYST